MKRIKITQITEPNKHSVYIKDKKYFNVFIGLIRLYFTNGVRAKKFIADSNRFLNSILHECNYLLGEIYVEYRKVWFYTKQHTEIDVDRDIESRMLMINKHFNWLTTRSETSMNGNANAFDFLGKISDNLLFIATGVKEVYKIKEHYADFQRLDVFINQLITIKKRIEDWGMNINELETE
mgnify:CR=1 FL=1